MRLFLWVVSLIVVALVCLVFDYAIKSKLREIQTRAREEALNELKYWEDRIAFLRGKVASEETKAMAVAQEFAAAARAKVASLERKLGW
jgi:hypothetical protein